MGFEPTRAEPIGLAVQRLNHSATLSLCSVYHLFLNFSKWSKYVLKVKERLKNNKKPTLIMFLLLYFCVCVLTPYQL